MGDRERLQVHGSLWLLIRSFKTRVHDRATVEAIRPHVTCGNTLDGTLVRQPLDLHSAQRASVHRAAVARTTSESDRRSASLRLRAPIEYLGSAAVERDSR
jgi:hypothetical protein